jgi:pimeloyl-ACP methyl ester carboxylesterase
VADWVYERAATIDDRLPGLDIATLLIWATADPISPLGIGRRLAALLPRARLVELAHEGHMFGRDRPDEVAPLIAAHLAGP